MHNLVSNNNFYELSIIIPVFESEQYLPRALQSIYAGTLKSFEIIIVDDYSSGNCQDILTGYSNITYIKHKFNKGLFAARKTGVEAAKGEFIIHLDPDDWIQKDIYQEALTKAQTSDLDIVIFGVEECDSEGKTWSSPNNLLSSKNLLSGYELLQRILMLPNAWIWHIAVNKLVRRSIALETLAKLPSIPRVNMFEDLLWSVFLSLLNTDNKKISVLSTIGYRYFRHDKSITLARERHAAIGRLADGLIVRNIIQLALGNKSTDILPFIDVRLVRIFNGTRNKIGFNGLVQTSFKYIFLALNYYYLKFNLKRYPCETVIIKEFDFSRISSTAKIYIFGCGELSKLIANKLSKKNIGLTGFISSHQTSSPLPNISFFDIDVIKDCKANDVIIIGSVGSAKVIYDLIKVRSELVTIISAFGENRFAIP